MCKDLDDILDNLPRLTDGVVGKLKIDGCEVFIPSRTNTSLSETICQLKKVMGDERVITPEEEYNETDSEEYKERVRVYNLFQAWFESYVNTEEFMKLTHMDRTTFVTTITYKAFKEGILHGNNTDAG